MAAYFYRARDLKGNLVKGVIESDSQVLAVKKIREKNYFLIELKETELQNRGLSGYSLARVKLKDLAVFCRQLATMLNAGLPILSALNILRKQSDNKVLRLTLDSIEHSLQEGDTFSYSLQKHPQVFPVLMVNMIEAGELGGILEEVLNRLAVHFEKEQDITEKVKSAVTYPVVVLAVTFFALVFLLTFVLPTFSTMLANMNVPLPFLTQLVLGISELLLDWWYLLAILFTGATYAFYRYLKTPGGRARWDRLLLRLPLFGGLLTKVIISRFSRTLGTLLQGGVPVLQALQVVKKTAGNLVIAEGLQKAQLSIRDGGGIAKPLEATRIFPPMVIEMIAIGEETGALDRLLAKISDFYDAEVDNTVARLSSIIEPLLIVILGGVVGLIIVSILLPVFNMMGGI